MRVFVYEYLSGGGLIEADAVASATLMPLGVSMRDALVADLLGSGACEITVAGSAGAGPVPWPARETRAAVDESPFDFVARVAAAHDAAWVIAPETDGLLARMQQLVGPARWIGCDPAAIELATHKPATLQLLRAHGIATPLDFDAAESTAQWVVKPADGAGSVDTRLHDTPDAARAYAAAREAAGARMTVEPFVEGAALSLSLACAADDTELLSINRQRIGRTRDGQLSFDGVDVNALDLNDRHGIALQALSQRVAGAMAGLRGFVGIDVVWHAERGPVVIEVNPRVTCALVGLSAALGRNVGAALLAAWQAERSASHV